MPSLLGASGRSGRRRREGREACTEQRLAVCVLGEWVVETGAEMAVSTATASPATEEVTLPWLLWSEDGRRVRLLSPGPVSSPGLSRV